MIVEIRTYTIKPGFRDRFLRFFEDKSRPLQESKGIKVLGPFIDLENENTVVCLRGFPSLQERERMRGLFYGGPEWKEELKAEAMAMLDSYSVVLAETAACKIKFDEDSGSCYQQSDT